jgi:hypothetical protein
VAAAVVMLDLDLAVAVLLAHVAGGVVSTVAGEGGRTEADDGGSGDHGGGDELAN